MPIQLMGESLKPLTLRHRWWLTPKLWVTSGAFAACGVAIGVGGAAGAVAGSLGASAIACSYIWALR